MIPRYDSQSSSFTGLTLAPYMSAAGASAADSPSSQQLQMPESSRLLTTRIANIVSQEAAAAFAENIPSQQFQLSESSLLLPTRRTNIVSQQVAAPASAEDIVASTGSRPINLFGRRTILGQEIQSDLAQSSKRIKVDEAPESSDQIQSLPNADSSSLIAAASDAPKAIERTNVVRKENILKKMSINLLDTYSQISKDYQIKIDIKKQEDLRKLEIKKQEDLRKLEIKKQEDLRLEATLLKQKQEDDFRKAGYHVHKKLGSGVYGTVYKVSNIIEQNPNIFYAAKINAAIPGNPQRQALYAKVQRKESNLLESLTAADKVGRAHIVPLIKALELDTDVHCIIMELMESDLYNFMKKRNFLFNIKELRQITLKLVENLAFLSSQGIIHADLKPENILMKDEGDLRIADFGTSLTSKRDYMLIQSRFYRAPEVSARYPTLTPKVDIWSLGCIIFEIFTGKVLFKSNAEKSSGLEDCAHLVCQTKILGQNTHVSKGKLFRNIEQSQIPRDYAKKAYDFINSPCESRFDAYITHAKQRPLDQEELSLADLIKRMLDFNPESRISPEEALRHPFIMDLTTSRDEIPAAKASTEEPAAACSSSSRLTVSEESSTAKESTEDSAAACASSSSSKPTVEKD